MKSNRFTILFVMLVTFVVQQSYAQEGSSKDSSPEKARSQYVIKIIKENKDIPMIPGEGKELPKWFDLVSPGVSELITYKGQNAAEFTSDKNCDLYVIVYVKSDFFEKIESSIKNYYLVQE